MAAGVRNGEDDDAARRRGRKQRAAAFSVTRNRAARVSGNGLAAPGIDSGDGHDHGTCARRSIVYGIVG